MPRVWLARQSKQFLCSKFNVSPHLKNKVERGWRDGSVVKSTVLLEVLSLIPRNHMVVHNHV